MTKAMNYGCENGFTGVSVSPTYHMNMDALSSFMPEKYKLLMEFASKKSYNWNKNSIPVYDTMTGKIYMGMGLDRPSQTNCYANIYMAVKKSINTSTPVRSYDAKSKTQFWSVARKEVYYEYYDDVYGHVFIAIEDVPIKIIKVAIERQLNEKGKREEKACKDFCKASSELDKALKEAKELLK